MSTPTERPILFSGAMVRALLDGRKTQTRRVITPPIPDSHPKSCKCEVCEIARPDWRWYHKTPGTVTVAEAKPILRRCPYGKVGDLLWVRETWRWDNCHDDGFEDMAPTFGMSMIDYKAGGTPYPHGDIWQHHDLGPCEKWSANEECMRSKEWRPSIHMPKWASRIWLEITGVRVERLSSISREDAIAEGISDAGYNTPGVMPAYRTDGQPVADFIELWNSINGKRPGCSWADGPWVWAITFRTIER